MRIGFKIELNFHGLHKNLVYIDNLNFVKNV